MDAEEKKRQILLHTLVGELLATGLTNGEIIEHLQLECNLSETEAPELLRAVYDSWTSVKEGLNLQAKDTRNWHQHLRMKLLQQTLKDKTIPAQRLALQILDSLATIDGIQSVAELTLPLSIRLVAKETNDDT